MIGSVASFVAPLAVFGTVPVPKAVAVPAQAAAGSPSAGSNGVPPPVTTSDIQSDVNGINALIEGVAGTVWSRIPGIRPDQIANVENQAYQAFQGAEGSVIARGEHAGIDNVPLKFEPFPASASTSAAQPAVAGPPTTNSIISSSSNGVAPPTTASDIQSAVNGINAAIENEGRVVWSRIPGITPDQIAASENNAYAILQGAEGATVARAGHAGIDSVPFKFDPFPTVASTSAAQPDNAAQVQAVAASRAAGSNGVAFASKSGADVALELLTAPNLQGSGAGNAVAANQKVDVYA